MNIQLYLFFSIKNIDSPINEHKNRAKLFWCLKMRITQDHDRALVIEINDMDFRFEHNLYKFKKYNFSFFLIQNSFFKLKIFANDNLMGIESKTF